MYIDQYIYCKCLAWAVNATKKSIPEYSEHGAIAQYSMSMGELEVVLLKDIWNKSDDLNMMNFLHTHLVFLPLLYAWVRRGTEGVQVRREST